MKKNLVIGAVVVIVLIGIVMFLQKDKSGDSVGLMTGKNAINVAEQAPSSEARISLAVLEAKGYIVIHKISAGAPGEVIGASELLPKGKSENTPVSLMSPMQIGQKYAAMLHLDDGDGVFDAVVDIPALDSVSGSPVMMEFEVSAAGGPDAVSI